MSAPPTQPSADHPAGSHRRRRRVRRSDLRWLLTGLLVPLPLLALAVALADALRERASESEAPAKALAARPAPEQPRAPPASTGPERTGAESAALTASPRRCAETGTILPPLVDAAACGDDTRLRGLLGNERALAQRDPRRAFDGYTALHHAVARGDLDAAKLLLEAGADPDSRDARGSSPLHLLAEADKVVGDAAIARALIGAGATVSLRNQAGRAPLDELRRAPRQLAASAELEQLLEAAALQQARVSEARAYLERRALAAQAFEPLALGDAAIPGVFASPVAPGEKAPASPRSDDEPGAVRRLIEDWAQAWNEGRAERYLAHYATGFRPPEGLARAQWEAALRERLASASRERRSITELQVDVRAERARARLVRTDSDSGTGARIQIELTLERAGSGWQIVEER